MRRQPGSLKVALGAGVGFLCGVLLIVVLALTRGNDAARPAATTHTPTIARVVVPDVVGLRLDVARERVQQEGYDVERAGGGLFGVVVESNWQVDDQTPPAGTELARGATVELHVGRP
jgi:beta-lactam-binding protein with PASTA domain